MLRERLAGAENLGLRLANRIVGPKPVEEILVHLNAVPARRRADRVLPVRRHRVGEDARTRIELGRRLGARDVAARIGDAGDRRAIAGFGARDILVDRADRRTLSVEGRIGSIGGRQGAIESFRPRAIHRREGDHGGYRAK